jgi:hypothetical protein
VNDKVIELQTKLTQLQHAMQSGVAELKNYDDSCFQPKHLRVGVNTALVETSAMARLLMSKNIITEEEYWTSLVHMMQNEVNMLTNVLEHRTGRKITLV